MLHYLINFLLIMLPPSHLFGLRRWLLRIANIEIHGSVCFCGGGWIFGRGNLKIDKGTWLSPSTVFYTHTEAPIVVGENCDIGPGVKFIPGEHEIGIHSRRAGKGTAEPIVITDGFWIGAYSLILEGATIGRGSVLSRDVKADVLAAGVPMMVKRELCE